MSSIIDITDDFERELKCLELRFKFADQQFTGLVWQSLQKAGWIYNPNTKINGHSTYSYQAPDGKIFASAQAVADYLDKFAFENVYSNLQSFETPPDEIDEPGKLLRRNALRILLEKTRTGNALEPKQCSRSLIKDEDASTSSRSKRPSRASSSNHLNSTVTSTEHGTHLYLHKNSKGRGKRKASTTLAIDGSMPSMVFPSIPELQAMQFDLSEVLATELEFQTNHFADWRFLLSTNHSLLFYGAGSKYNLLNSFCEHELEKEGYAVIINGFDKSACVQVILNVLVQSLLDDKEPEPMSKLCDHVVVGKSTPWKAPPLLERAVNVSRALAQKASETLLPIFLVIHNLDGEGLRDSLSQEALALLVVNSTVENGVAAIRLAASVDHVDAPALLSPTVSCAANFAWIHKVVHTHRPYHHEFALLGDEEKDKKKKKVAKHQSMTNNLVQRFKEVLDTLSKKHTEVIQVLARHQLKTRAEWTDWVVFATACKATFIVKNDTQLKAYISELLDHGLMLWNKTDKSLSELVRIPTDRSTLRKLVDYVRES